MQIPWELKNLFHKNSIWNVISLIISLTNDVLKIVKSQ